MGFSSQLKGRSAPPSIVRNGICFSVPLFTALLVDNMQAQCEVHSDYKTALKFSNESRFELTFFVDDEEKGVVVPSKGISNEISVEPGDHLLRARAILRERVSGFA